MGPPLFDTPKYQPTSGYVLLITMLVIGAVGTTIATSLVLLGTGASRNGAVLQSSVEAKALANACAERALQRIWDTPNFSGTVPLTIGNGSCTYTITHNGGENRTVTASGTRGNAVRHITILVNEVTSTVGVSAWSETTD